MLSNNHVLANENNAQAGDVILQPGPLDGGREPADIVARLKSFVPLTSNGSNTVDCAIATIEDGINFDASSLEGLGRLTGVRSDIPGDGNVGKVGRTTGVTRGKISAFEVDGVVISYDIGTLTFDNVIEIDNATSSRFAAGGDSGSLIVGDQGLAIGLLFAVSDQGGSAGTGLSYANHIVNVLTALNVQLRH